MLRLILVAGAVLFFLPVTVSAQYESPVAYMNYLTTIEGDVARDYLSYMSAMAHTNSARKLEKRRAEVVGTVKEGRTKVTRLKAFDGDVTLRSAYTDYLTVLYAVMTEDYGKIVDMEDIAEQSYDKMEAWLLAQEKAREKLKGAADTLRVNYRRFAAKNNVKLVESESKVSKKLDQTGTVMVYYNQVFLIHFKTFKQESYTITALNMGDINGVEQNRSTQSAYAEEGLAKLQGIKAFENDYSLVVACRKLLEFQKVEADTRLATLADFLLKKEEFEKFKKDYDGKPSSQRTNIDVEDYNSFASEMNKLSANYNKVNDQLNTQRNALVEQWNAAVDRFLDTHIPK